MACNLPNECLVAYTCDQAARDTDAFKLMHKGAIVAPFVEIRFGLNQELLTVGNNSSPPYNTSVITSFQTGSYGENGFGAEFEIFDHGGGMYKSVILAMNKTAARISKEISERGFTFDYGWIIKKTDGQVSKISASESQSSRGYFTGQIVKVDTIFEGQNVKMNFKVTGALYRTPDLFNTNVIGSGSTANGRNNKINLRSALKELFTKYEPKYKDVIFKDKDGSEENFAFYEGGREGPLSVWQMSQQHQMSIARSWLNVVRSKNGFGFTIGVDAKTQKIVIQEDKLNTQITCDPKNLVATYIVNGGNCSPVIEFVPSVTWHTGMNIAGGATTGSANSGVNSEIVGKDINTIQKAGTQSIPVASQNQLEFRMPDEIPIETRKAFEVNLKANSLMENIQPGFEADLKIHGDPSYSDFLLLSSKFVSIIVMNPFYIKDSIWIQESNCNQVLSNKHYQIIGVNHSIQAGSYITTLKLRLLQPNITLDANAGLGRTGLTFPETSLPS
jgi:hypothetical protein